MSTQLHIGAKELRGTLSAYAKRFDLLEIPIALLPRKGGAARDKEPGELRTVPSPGTLRRWRKEVPPHFEFSVVAGPALARLKPGPEFDAELAGARAALDVLQARCFVVRTPPEVTPAAIWRGRLGRLFDAFPRDVTRMIWEPSGVWDLDEAARVAKGLGAVLAVDAARDAVPAGAVAYVRLRALGETRSFGVAALERVLDAVGERRDAYFVLETDGALQEAKRLRELAQRPGGRSGGMNRLVRPRGDMLVRDDEQE